MPTLAVFITGVVVGSAVHVLSAQTAPQHLALNHVAITVTNFDETISFYKNTFGMKEAFAFRDATDHRMAYLQINRDTFIELSSADATHSPGISHFGLEVDDLGQSISRFQEHGLKVEPPTVSARTAVRLAQSRDINGVSIELLEIGSDSLHRKAMNSWKR